MRGSQQCRVRRLRLQRTAARLQVVGRVRSGSTAEVADAAVALDDFAADAAPAGSEALCRRAA
jgi:hypothetical protein